MPFVKNPDRSCWVWKATESESPISIFLYIFPAQGIAEAEKQKRLTTDTLPPLTHDSISKSGRDQTLGISLPSYHVGMLGDLLSHSVKVIDLVEET